MPFQSPLHRGLRLRAAGGKAYSRYCGVPSSYFSYKSRTAETQGADRSSRFQMSWWPASHITQSRRGHVQRQCRPGEECLPQSKSGDDDASCRSSRANSCSAAS
jgi:hypothetical protein